jgi:K+/H+ antiporter YhaU regulatory subunit KhtT
MHESKQKDFLIAMRVKPGRSGAAGKSIAANGLRDINGLHIVAISRPGSGEVIVDASPHCVLQVGFELGTSKVMLASCWCADWT